MRIQMAYFIGDKYDYVLPEEDYMTDHGKNVAVMGIYPTRAGAENGADILMRAGFRASAISVLVPENLTGTRTGRVPVATTPVSTESVVNVRPIVTEKSTKAPEGTAAGATTGAVLGGGLGLLAGIGALAIPGLGPFIAAGPIMAALAGLGVGGAVGGVTGALIGLGIPEYEAKRYEGRLKEGGILLSVHCDTSDEIKRAKQLLSASGADDISSTHEASASSDQARAASN